jgi:hypothetical protein
VFTCSRATPRGVVNETSVTEDESAQTTDRWDMGTSELAVAYTAIGILLAGVGLVSSHAQGTPLRWPKFAIAYVFWPASVAAVLFVAWRHRRRA